MAFTEPERQEIDKILHVFMEKRRPPVELRSEVDFQCRISGQSIQIVEIRPRWQAPGEFTEMGCAKLTYVRSLALWKIYWMRRDLKWHSYKPVSQVGTLEKALAVIDEDRYGCFFG
jgi:hypothetical protein